MKAVYLDTGVLGFLTHPKGSTEATECTAWLLSLLQQGVKVCLPEICDYEIRREYVLQKSKKALTKLDALKETAEYVPIASPMMLKAAELWADVRSKGKPTADNKALDGDVILVAQALVSDSDNNLHIATTNVAHLSLFTKASLWRDVTHDN